MSEPLSLTMLAHLSPQHILTAAELAACCGVHIDTIRRQWHEGKLPPPFQLPDQQHAWYVKDLLAHWDTNRVQRPATPGAIAITRGRQPPQRLAGQPSPLRSRRHAKP